MPCFNSELAVCSSRLDPRLLIRTGTLRGVRTHR